MVVVVDLELKVNFDAEVDWGTARGKRGNQISGGRAIRIHHAYRAALFTETPHRSFAVRPR
jgi:hypothetical protein